MRVDEIKNNHTNFVPDCFDLNTNKNFLRLKLDSAIAKKKKLPTEIRLSNLQLKNTQKQINT